jgi:hypothetical protein
MLLDQSPDKLKDGHFAGATDVEVGIVCVIALAIGYWGALWLVACHNDVLHGDFVQAEPQLDLMATPRPTSAPSSSDSLQQLLGSIKQDLKDAAQI